MGEKAQIFRRDLPLGGRQDKQDFLTRRARRILAGADGISPRRTLRRSLLEIYFCESSADIRGCKCNKPKQHEAHEERGEELY